MFKAMLREADTEKDLVDAMEGYVRRAGGTRTSFQPICAVGERGALPHAPPGNKPLGEGSKLLVDWGAELNGYRSDLTRTLRSPFQVAPSRRNKMERVGYSLDAAATLGPVISQPQLDKVLSYIDVGRAEGAELLCGGQRLGGELENGYFVQPSVFGGVTNEMRIAREEIFGPVLSILPFDAVDEAIASEYGLGGAVWS